MAPLKCQGMGVKGNTGNCATLTLISMKVKYQCNWHTKRLTAVPLANRCMSL